MELGKKELTKDQDVNVLSLYGKAHHDIIQEDPLKELLDEAQSSDGFVSTIKLQERRMVTEEAFPDQSVYILEDQLFKLRSRLARLKFYLDEVDDLILSKKP